MRISELISISLDGFFSGENGCYVYVSPTEITFKQAFVKMFPELPVTPDGELHCTVMYSPEGTPDKDAAFTLLDTDREFPAAISELVCWEGHDKAGYMVLKLTSLDLSNRHMQWRGLGCVPTFPDYTPHITMAKKVELTDELKQKIAEFNAYLTGLPSDSKTLIFNNEHIEDIKD